MLAAPTDFCTPTGAAVDGEPSPTHRRRGAVLEDAIVEAVFAELSEVGYAAFTIESVAARAQTGKASIYRRWPTKQDLVLTAFCHRFGSPESFIDDTMADATTRDIFVAIGRRIIDVCESAGEAIRAVACEVTRSRTSRQRSIRRFTAKSGWPRFGYWSVAWRAAKFGLTPLTRCSPRYFRPCSCNR